MTPSSPALQNAPGIVGLFPELLGVGGVQEASRQTAHALRNISARLQCPIYFLGLNDAPGPHEYSVGGTTIALRGFGRSKLRFVLSRDGLCQKKAAPRPRCASKPGGSRNVDEAPLRAVKVIVFAHGVDVWEPLSPAATPPSWQRI